MVKEPLHNGTSLLLVCFHHLCESFSLSALGLNCLIRQRASHIPGHLPTAPSMALQGLPVTSFPRFFFLNLQPEPGRQGVGGDCCPGGCTYLFGK